MIFFPWFPMRSTVRRFQWHVNSLLLCHFQDLSSETMRKKATKFRLRKIFTCHRIKAPAKGQGIVNKNQAVSYWQGMKLLNKHALFISRLKESKKKERWPSIGAGSKKGNNFLFLLVYFTHGYTFVVYHFDDAVTTFFVNHFHWWLCEREL